MKTRTIILEAVLNLESFLVSRIKCETAVVGMRTQHNYMMLYFTI